MLFPLLLALTAPPASSADWVYLDNGKIRLGVDRSSGACIGYLSESGSSRNLLNHFDRGRFVQQSYYGDEDGSIWAKTPWRYNPVQGGEYRGGPSRLTAFRSHGGRMYARLTPRNWAGGQLLPEVTMEEWIDLHEMLVHVRYKMTYRGGHTHEKRSQEIPAVFTDPSLSTLVTYAGDRPWTGGALTARTPGWPNETQPITESWFAYVDDQGYGVGACVPVSHVATCYRYTGSPESACSYAAPLTEFALTPGFTFSYDLYLTVGASAAIRARFAALGHRTAAPMPARSSELGR